MRSMTLTVCLLLAPCISAAAEVSVAVRLPGVSIGINMPRYPDLVAIPGYPVYYDPEVDSNFFFYDGLYWAYADDQWYASSWYNGPWDLMRPERVPYFVLRVPVRYYRRPPVYFRGWASEAPPRWGEHWGRDWEQRRPGWDRWDRASAPRPAPLPTYQREYSGNRYPGLDQQHALRSQNYHYEPREPVVRRVYQSAPQKRATVPTSVQRSERAAPPVPHTSPAAPRADRPPPAEHAGTERRQDPQRPQDRKASQPRRDKGPPPREAPPSREASPPRPDKASPPRSREQNGEPPGNAPTRDKNDRRGEAGGPDRDH